MEAFEITSRDSICWLIVPADAHVELTKTGMTHTDGTPVYAGVASKVVNAAGKDRVWNKPSTWFSLYPYTCKISPYSFLIGEDRIPPSRLHPGRKLFGPIIDEIRQLIGDDLVIY